MPFRQLENTEPQQQEEASKEQQSNPEQPQEQKQSGFRVLSNPEQPMKKQKEATASEAFKKGLQESASGQLLLTAGTQNELPDYDTTFWQSVIKEGGTLIGDTPWMAVGGVLGAPLGGAVGALVGPGGSGPGSVVGGAFGAFALPAFMKQSMREYRQFQERGGNLTFGEFLGAADRVAGQTLREGTFGVILNKVKSSIKLLEKIPGIKNLFDTRYVGSTIKGGTEIAAETGAATTIPAALEGRLPDKEDVARAAILFTGGRAASIPGQVSNIIKGGSSEKLNYALADEINRLDLSYPPLQEFKTDHHPIYKNSIDLDRNLTSFDKSYIENMVNRINSISETEFANAHEAGTRMQELITPTIENTNIEELPKPEKPIDRVVPLAENPFRVALDTISAQPAASKAELGRSTNRAYHQARQQEYEPLNQRYDNFETLVTGEEVVDQAGYDIAEAFLNDFGETQAANSEEMPVIGRVRRLRDMFVNEDEEGNLTPRIVPVSQVIATVRSLRSIPDWDMPPSVRNRLGHFIAEMDEFIHDHLANSSDEVAAEYLNLRNDYAAFKQRFDNSDMGIFWKRTNQNESISTRFTALDKFQQLEQALNNTPAGQRALNQLRREAWEKKIGDKPLEARTEESFAEQTSGFDERFYNDLMEYLDPEQRQIVLDAMRHSDNIRQSARDTADQNFQSQQQYQSEMAQWKRNVVDNRNNARQAKEVQSKQDLLVSLLKQDPALIVGNMKTIEGIKRVKEATRKVQDGNKLYDSLARYETEQMFNFMGEGYLRTGRVPYTEMKIQLNNKEFRSKLKELNGEKFVKEMDELVEVADKLSKNFKDTIVKFRDDPSTINTILQIYAIMGLSQGNILTPLMAFTAKKNLLKIGNKAWNMWTAGKNYDPATIQKYIDAGRAVNKGNKKQIQKEGQKIKPPFYL